MTNLHGVSALAFLEHLTRSDSGHAHQLACDKAYQFWVNTAATIVEACADSLEGQGISRSVVLTMVKDVAERIAESNKAGRELETWARRSVQEQMEAESTRPAPPPALLLQALGPWKGRIG